MARQTGTCVKNFCMVKSCLFSSQEAFIENRDRTSASLNKCNVAVTSERIGAEGTSGHVNSTWCVTIKGRGNGHSGANKDIAVWQTK
jgi:hypothetical protein